MDAMPAPVVMIAPAPILVGPDARPPVYPVPQLMPPVWQPQPAWQPVWPVQQPVVRWVLPAASS